MKLTLLHEDESTLAVRIEGATLSYLNTLRRLSMTEVPTMAIESVEFGKNNSILYDEMVAHRLGLVPLKTDLKGYAKKETHGEAGNPTNEATLTLKVAKSKGEHIVTAGELTSSDPKIVPAIPEIPIVKLIDGQDIELIAKAELGTGKEHVKWSPCLAYYRPYPKITITKQPKNAAAVAAKYPNLFTEKGGKLSVADGGEYYAPDATLDLDGGEVRVDVQDDDVIFVIESWGQLPPREIIEHSLAIYDEQLEAFSKAL